MSDTNTFSFRFRDRAFTYDVQYPALSFNLVDYSFTAEGGPELCDLDAFGSITAIYDCVDMLRRPIEVSDFTGETRWWGYVSEVQIVAGMWTVGVTIDSMFNAIQVTYTVPGSSVSQSKTAWYQDAVSQSIYGVKQQIRSGGTTGDATAATAAQTALNQLHLPIPTTKNTRGAKDIVAHIKCRGWYDTLDWEYYSQIAGQEVYEESDSLSPIGVGMTSTTISFDAAYKRIWDLNAGFALFPSAGKVFCSGAANAGNNALFTINAVNTAAQTVYTASTISFTPGVNEVQSLFRPATVTGGTFQITYAPNPTPTSGPTSFTTPPLAWNAAASVVQTNLTNMMGAGTATVVTGYSALSIPVAPTLTPSGTGGTLPPNSYQYRISAVGLSGQTVPGPEATVAATTTGSTGSVAVAWSTVPSAISYNVYGRYAGVEQLLKNVLTNSYTDTGADNPTGSMPSSDTSASTYVVTFTGGLAGQNQNALVALSTGLTGTGSVAPGAITVYETTMGVAPRITDTTTGISAFQTGDFVRIGGATNAGDYFVRNTGSTSGSNPYLEVNNPLTTAAAGASVTMTRGNYVTTVETPTFEMPGNSITATNWGNKAAQKFQQSSTVSWSVAAIAVRVQTVGAPLDSLRVSLCADNATFGVPGTVLESVDTPGANLPSAMDWYQVTFSNTHIIAPATNYWVTVERTGSNDGVNAFQVNYMATGNYANGYAQVYESYTSTWQSPPGRVYRASDMAFRVIGNWETSVQAAAITTAVGQFLTGARILNPSGVFSSQYRDGSLTGMAELTKLIDQGQTTGRRMLCRVTKDRALEIYAEPAQGVSNYAIDSVGKVYDAQGNEIPARQCPVGVWMDLRDVIPAGAATHTIAAPTPFFVERMTFVAASVELRPEPRGVDSPWSIGSTKAG